MVSQPVTVQWEEDEDVVILEQQDATPLIRLGYARSLTQIEVDAYNDDIDTLTQIDADKKAASDKAAADKAAADKAAADKAAADKAAADKAAADKAAADKIEADKKAAADKNAKA